jgi:hypothetical protein
MNFNVFIETHSKYIPDEKVIGRYNGKEIFKGENLSIDITDGQMFVMDTKGEKILFTIENAQFQEMHAVVMTFLGYYWKDESRRKNLVQVNVYLKAVQQ